MLVTLVLGGLLALLALNAFAGGYYGLLGAKDVPPEWLEGSPFSNYFIPSLFLFVVIGGFLTLAAVAVFARWRNARALALGAGVLVLAWLAIQVMILGYVSWMQPATAILALLILVLATRVTAPAALELPVMTIKDAATQFLKHKRIAVTGVSRHGTSHGANIVYQRLRQRGYQVFAVNPNAKEVEGDIAFPNLRSIPGGVDAVVIGTRPAFAEATMRECAELGIEHVWMHRSVDKGSVSDAATAYGRKHGIAVIDGGCPLMFAPVGDPAHKCMKLVLTLTGKVPRHCS